MLRSWRVILSLSSVSLVSSEINYHNTWCCRLNGTFLPSVILPVPLYECYMNPVQYLCTYTAPSYLYLYLYLPIFLLLFLLYGFATIPIIMWLSLLLFCTVVSYDLLFLLFVIFDCISIGHTLLNFVLFAFFTVSTTFLCYYRCFDLL